jgi:hypothetical protein
VPYVPLSFQVLVSGHARAASTVNSGVAYRCSGPSKKSIKMGTTTQ